jgi:hypothetical protein
MGRTIPSWRIIVEQKIAEFSRFNQSLRPEDRVVFEDLLNQCKLYAPQASVLASPVAEVPLLLSMIFAQHKRLTELEKRLNQSDSICFTHESDSRTVCDTSGK